MIGHGCSHVQNRTTDGTEGERNQQESRVRLAFIGFRHAHIMGLYQDAMDDPSVQVVASAEADPQSAAQLSSAGRIRLTHDDPDRLLREVECDAVAIGDVYGRRGAIAIAALRAGRHVISDKPLCTELAELSEIAELSSQRNLRVGCMLDMRARGSLRAMRAAILANAIGPVHTVTFTGQHPLLLGSRPQWYFEPSCHGGTINDIAIHAIDFIPWLTGRRITEVVAARAWNARLPQYPHFQDGAQLMLRMDNGGGVLGDVSYLAPEKSGYKLPQYWRITCHGSDGMVEVDGNHRVTIATGSDTEPRPIDPHADMPHLCLDMFRRDIAGTSQGDDLTTAQVLSATRQALLIQQAADQQLTSQPL